MERSRDSCVLIFRNLGPLGFGYTVISLLPKSILAVSLTNLFPGNILLRFRWFNLPVGLPL